MQPEYFDIVHSVQHVGRGVDHTASSTAEVKERAELYLYSPSVPSFSVLGLTSTFYYHIEFDRNLSGRLGSVGYIGVTWGVREANALQYFFKRGIFLLTELRNGK
jgi:hypothetical protein